MTNLVKLKYVEAHSNDRGDPCEFHGSLTITIYEEYNYVLSAQISYWNSYIYGSNIDVEFVTPLSIDEDQKGSQKGGRCGGT